MVRVLLIFAFVAAVLAAFAEAQSYETRQKVAKVTPERPPAAWMQTAGWLFGLVFGSTSSPPVQCNDLLFIPAGQNSSVLNEKDIPVKACNSQRETPIWWAFPFVVSRLHISIEKSSSLIASDHPPQLVKRKSWNLPHMLPESAVCKWWLQATGFEVPRVCESHRSRTFTKAVDNIPGSLDYEVYLAWPDSFLFGQPAEESDSCVCFASLPADATTIRVSWQDAVCDPVVFACLLSGMFLMIYCQSLQESPTFHAVLGGLTALVLWTLAFGWWIVRNMKRTVGGVPVFGGVFSFMFVTAFATLPSFRNMLNPFRSLSVVKDWLWAWLNIYDPFGYNLPIGWILTFVFLIVALVAIHFGAKWSMSFFASPPEPEGDVDFTIGADGRRIDILPSKPWSQWSLGCLIWLVGLAAVLRSTHATSCSLAFALLIVSRRHLNMLAPVFCSCSRRSQMTAEDLRPLMSLNTYDTQTKLHTTNAVERLREYLRTHPDVYCLAGNDQAELRLRRFSAGGPHLHQHRQSDDVFDTFSDRSSCTML